MSDSNIPFKDFEREILYFNAMYKLPVAAYPSLRPILNSIPDPKLSVAAKLLQRLANFKNILTEELEEIEEIKTKLIVANAQWAEGKEPEYTELDFLTDVSDLLGDIQVYCASEMAKFGLPIREVQKIIMQSNFSKQGADGKPIYDERGKVLKGPGYWKPEPRIKQMLSEKILDADPKKDPLAKGIVWREGEGDLK